MVIFFIPDRTDVCRCAVGMQEGMNTCTRGVRQDRFYYFPVICALTVVSFISLLAMCLAQHFIYLISFHPHNTCVVDVIAFMFKRERRLRPISNVPKVTRLKT